MSTLQIGHPNRFGSNCGVRIQTSLARACQRPSVRRIQVRVDDVKPVERVLSGAVRPVNGAQYGPRRSRSKTDTGRSTAISTLNWERAPLAFQADDAGSIPATRSTENPYTARVFARPQPRAAPETKTCVPNGSVRTAFATLRYPARTPTSCPGGRITSVASPLPRADRAPVRPAANRPNGCHPDGARALQRSGWAILPTQRRLRRADRHRGSGSSSRTDRRTSTCPANADLPTYGRSANTERAPNCPEILTRDTERSRPSGHRLADDGDWPSWNLSCS